MKALILALIFLATPLLASADPFTVIAVDTRREQLELFLTDDTGAPFRRLDNLDAWLESQRRQLRFAMNAGMFEPDLSPVGLFVTQGRELKALNLANGRGNFFLKPNGVFFLTQAGPRIVRSTKYSAPADKVLLATQSGPLLLEDGSIHPAFNPASTSKYIRNGVGVRGDEAIFVISNGPVTFYEFAVYFKDQLHCTDALYFDGAVSSLFAPDLGRRDSTVDLGPMIGVVK
ncbi:phosphodiester glycosidase family protein [Steroidobacter cummioxidans]|uniref:phosphodiester glycosidase family protein n=1 Tax=Steroidobacter cummioxidans TaxID=1803913 RepID=UPI000E31B978|nr:phosphodiester glycosidase family protein [Steroidobacter cummioxidans]